MNITKRQFNISMAVMGAGLVTGCSTFTPKEKDFTNVVDIETLELYDFELILVGLMLSKNLIDKINPYVLTTGTKADILKSIGDVRSVLERQKRLNTNMPDSIEELAKIFDERYEATNIQKLENVLLTKKFTGAVELNADFKKLYDEKTFSFGWGVYTLDRQRFSHYQLQSYAAIIAANLGLPRLRTRQDEELHDIVKITNNAFVIPKVLAQPKFDYSREKFRELVYNNKRLNVEFKSVVKFVPKWLYFSPTRSSYLYFEHISTNSELIKIEGA